MFKKSDYFILMAVVISFFTSAYLWFVVQDREQSILQRFGFPQYFALGFISN
jgi:hypothetical protein